MNFGSVPFLATRVRDDVAWITWLYVPPGLRRRGVGRHMVEAWQAHVPQGVKQIRLLAAEVDGVDPIPFWEKLGFHDDAELPWVDEVPMRVMSRAVDDQDRGA